MHSEYPDTIIQLATPRFPSAIHIIRISGNQSYPFITQHTKLISLKPRRASLTLFFSHTEIIDQILCIFFSKNHSYTGEKTVEIYCHGSLLIVDEILKAGLLFGLRLAKPGEFTYRAYLNGKLTLEQAESVHTLIKSESAINKNSALSILTRRRSLCFTEYKERINSLQMVLEKVISFPDEKSNKNKNRHFNSKSDNKFFSSALKTLRFIHTQLKNNLESFKIFKDIENGIKVHIFGPPNTGKSTLFNLLIQKDRALTSPTPGTTRDYVNEKIFLNSFPVILYDTAGLHDTTHTIEAAGIQKSIALLQESDISLILLDSVKSFTLFKKYLILFKNKNVLFYITKSDLLTTPKKKYILSYLKNHHISPHNFITCTQPNTIQKISRDITRLINKKLQFNSRDPSLLSDRQFLIVQDIITLLQSSIDMIQSNQEMIILIQTLDTIRKLFSDLTCDNKDIDILDEIFSSFCIGK